MFKKLWKGILLLLLQGSFKTLLRCSSSKGHLEVERKFKITEKEAQEIPDRIRAAGFSPRGVVEMEDTFLPAPAGEMMRVRDEWHGPMVRSCITWKFWVNTAGGGKEREESECSVSPLVRTIFLLLARRAVGELLSFRKRRRLYEGHLAGWPAVVSLDEVQGLGPFSGDYLEVECIVPKSTEVGSVRHAIYGLATSILGDQRDDEKCSYREMLELSKQG